MSPTCIITDSAAQFAMPAFNGHELVSVVPLHIRLDGRLYTDGQDLKVKDLPLRAYNGQGPRLAAPSAVEFRRCLAAQKKRFDQAVIIVHSSSLSDTYRQAEKAAAANSALPAQVIDSQTLSVGQGLLVQAAAGAALHGASAVEIGRLVGGLVPHVYTLLCLRNLGYLARSGQIDPAQGLVGELLGLTPLMTLEGGRLAPVRKISSAFQLAEHCIEYVSEFNAVGHLGLFQGLLPFDRDDHRLSERLQAAFPRATFSEHHIGAGLGAILGPKCLGLVVMER